MNRTTLPCYLFLLCILTNVSYAKTNEEIAGSLLMPSFEKGVKVKAFAQMLCDIHARSYIILRSDTSKQLVDSVQKTYETLCEEKRAKEGGREKRVLTVALDSEPSLMKYRMPKAVKKYALQETHVLHTDDEVRKSAQDIAEALLGAGIHITFAPLYDTGANKTIIGTRAFSSLIPKGYPDAGEDGGYTEATRKANLFMRESLKAGVIPTAKHFPGHGFAVGDTHKTIETIPGALPELSNFVSAIAHNVPAIMVGHLVVAGGEWDSDGLPATLSKKIMTELLRKKLGYTGIIITDSMAMGALRGQKDRSVRSLEAGADIILIPPDPRAAHKRIVEKMALDKVFYEMVAQKSQRVLDFYSN